jgi:hypothetical protein
MPGWTGPRWSANVNSEPGILKPMMKRTRARPLKNNARACLAPACKTRVLLGAVKTAQPSTQVPRSGGSSRYRGRRTEQRTKLYTLPPSTLLSSRFIRVYQYTLNHTIFVAVVEGVCVRDGRALCWIRCGRSALCRPVKLEVPTLVCIAVAILSHKQHNGRSSAFGGKPFLV